MKKISFLTIFVALSFSAKSQIDTFHGLHDLDSCRFENAWTLLLFDTSSENLWQIGKPSKPFFDTAYSAPNALVTDTVNPYGPSNHSYFDLTLGKYFGFNLILKFQHKYQTDSLTDGGYIELSYDSGVSWINVMDEANVHGPFDFLSVNLYKQTDTLKGGIPGFSGTSHGWINTQMQWIWAYPVITLADDFILRFHFISDSVQTNKAGWMIDNIVISYAEMWSVHKFRRLPVEIKISPNPLHNKAIVTFKNIGHEPLTFSVFNSLGQRIKQIENICTDQVEINRSDFNQGLYYLQLRNNDDILLGKAKLVVD